MRRRPAEEGGRSTAARSVAERAVIDRPHQPAAVERTSHLDAERIAQALDEQRRGGTRDLGHGPVGRPAQRLPARPLGLGQPLGVPQERRLDHLVARQPGLHQDPPTVAPAPDQTAGPDEQRQGLLARPGTAVPAAPGRSRGRQRARRSPPGAARPRCRRRCAASGVPGPRGPAPVISTTGSPSRTSSSSRARVTPMRRLRSVVEPQAAQTSGRTAPHRWQPSVPSSLWATAESQASHRASSPQARQASSRDRPVRFSTHTTAPPSPAGSAGGRHERRREQPGPGRCRPGVDRRPRSPASRPARRSGVASAWGPSTAPRAMGHGDTRMHGTPARRARSIATSRACQVGVRSSWWTSSCSSSTTTAASGEIGAQAAARAPITLTPPARACAQSRGTTATGTPGSPEPRGQLPGLAGSTGPPRGWAPSPRPPAPPRTDRRRAGAGARSRAAVRPPPPAPARRPPSAPGCQPVEDGATAGTARSGEAVPRSVARRPAQRQAAHRGQVDELGRRAPPRHLGQRAQHDARRRLDLVRHDPGPDPTAVELDPHHGADAHLVPERLGDQVVEGLVDRALGQDPHDPGSGRLAQRPSADFRSSTLSVRSQVKSSSSRPKWP